MPDDPVRPGPWRPAGRGRTPRGRRGRRTPRRAAARLRAASDPTAARASRPRCRRTSRTTSRCPAATSSTATSRGPGPMASEALDTPARQWGVATERRLGAALRLRRTARRRGERPRWAQRRPGRPRDALGSAYHSPKPGAPMSLSVVAVITAKPGSEDAVREAMQGLVAPTRAEEGCLSYSLSESVAAPGTFVTVEDVERPVRPRQAHGDRAHPGRSGRARQRARSGSGHPPADAPRRPVGRAPGVAQSTLARFHPGAT